jgi:RND family efflux transporter MFP subunit
LATILLTGCTRSSAQPPPDSAPPPEVSVRRIADQPVPLRFEFTGQSVSSHQVDVRARVAGYVINAPYTEGEFVEAGTLLFEIDPRPYLAAQARAEAEVARATAAIKLARQELERAERLAANDAIATEELQRRRTEVETAGALLAAAIAQREAAALDVEFTKVKAPVAGRVARSLVRPGNLISGGDASGTLLTTLVATTPLHVLFNVDEPAYRQLTDLLTFGTSLRAQVTIGGQGPSADGKLDYLAPSIDGRSGTAQARVILPNPDGRLAPGMFARVTVLADTPEPRLLVPETAIGARQGNRFVLVVNQDNRVVERTVVLGERRGNDRVVTDGLASGESIVVNGLQRIRPGMTVQPVEAALTAN